VAIITDTRISLRVPRLCRMDRMTGMRQMFTDVDSIKGRIEKLAGCYGIKVHDVIDRLMNGNLLYTDCNIYHR